MKDKLTSRDNFKTHVLQMIDEYMDLTGKLPNELHLSSQYHAVYEEIVNEVLDCTKPDIYGKRKHWWFMGCRVFYEIWSDFVVYNEETAEIANAA